MQEYIKRSSCVENEIGNDKNLKRLCKSHLRNNTVVYLLHVSAGFKVEACVRGRVCRQVYQGMIVYNFNCVDTLPERHSSLLLFDLHPLFSKIPNPPGTKVYLIVSTWYFKKIVL